MILDGEKHHVATVIIFSCEQPQRTLLLFHKKFRLWLPPGGHVEVYENPYEAAIREVREETGLEIREYLPAPIRLDETVVSLPVPWRLLEEIIPAYGDQPEHYHLDHTYVVEIPPQKVTQDISESDGIRWVTQEEMKGLEMMNDCKADIDELFNCKRSTK